MVHAIVAAGLALTAALSAASCASHDAGVPGGQPGAGGDVGVLEGQVYLRPTQPVVRNPELTGEEPDRGQPLQATLEVLDASDQVVAEVRADEEGHFRVELEPGEYVLRALEIDERPLPVPPRDVTVEIVAGETVTVEVVYDSGIR